MPCFPCVMMPCFSISITSSRLSFALTAASPPLHGRAQQPTDSEHIPSQPGLPFLRLLVLQASLSRLQAREGGLLSAVVQMLRNDGAEQPLGSARLEASEVRQLQAALVLAADVVQADESRPAALLHRH